MGTKYCKLEKLIISPQTLIFSQFLFTQIVWTLDIQNFEDLIQQFIISNTMVYDIRLQRYKESLLSKEWGLLYKIWTDMDCGPDVDLTKVQHLKVNFRRIAPSLSCGSNYIYLVCKGSV